MTSNEQGADVDVPLIEISDGWTVEDLRTQDDCDDAFAVLTGVICSIEAQIEKAQEDGRDSGEWYRRLKGALRWKKAALSVVQTKRGQISRRDRAATHAENIKREKDRNARLAAEFLRLFPKEYVSVVRSLGEIEG